MDISIKIISPRIKRFLLSIYNAVLPRESNLRYFLYNWILWQSFPDEIDKLLKEYAKSNQEIRFIQIGTNDGIYKDPLHKFISRFGWEGVLIEPIPEAFERLVRNYKKGNDRNLFFENIAITKCGGDLEMYSFDNGTGRFSVLSTSSEKSFKIHRQNFPTVPFKKIKVRSSTIMSVIKKYGLLDCHLIAIDTEGRDYEIIQSIDFSRVKPDLILFEHFFMNQYQYGKIQKVLKSKDYDFVKEKNNTLAFIKTKRS